MTLLRSEQVVDAVENLPSLPAVVAELLETIEKEDVDTEELAHKIARDQALAARALKVANSPFYGMQGKVASIQDAIVILGFRNVRALVTAAAITGAFPRQNMGWFDPHQFWRHSVGVALAARELARHARINGETAFTAGLLHDIGRLVLVTSFPAQYKQALDYRERHDCYVSEAERDVLGVDHAEVGRALAKRWRFPTSIQESVGYHHQAEDSALESPAGVVHVADVTAHALDLCALEQDMVPRLSAVAWNRLNLSWEVYKQILARVEEQFQSVCQALAV